MGNAGLPGGTLSGEAACEKGLTGGRNPAGQPLTLPTREASICSD